MSNKRREEKKLRRFGGAKRQQVEATKCARSLDRIFFVFFAFQRAPLFMHLTRHSLARLLVGVRA